jgi:hypothetical protein
MTDWAFSWPISVWFHSVSRHTLRVVSCERTLVVFDDVPQMVTTRVVRLAHAHRVVREVYIAIVACEMKRRSVIWP